VVLSLCARHGARRILWIGRRGAPLGLSLQQAGYTVWGMDPGGHRATDLAEFAPASPADATGMDPDPPRGEQVRFDLALSTESPEPCSALGERVQLAARALQPGGLFLLSTPYRGSLKSRLVALGDRWRQRRGRSRHGPSWSRPHVKRLLASHGFVLSELIGVRDASGPLKTVVWVARQGG
jgi:SAM-dependent methyltransferase